MVWWCLNNLNIELLYDSQLHFWAYTQKNRKQERGEVFAYLYGGIIHTSQEVEALTMDEWGKQNIYSMHKME